MDNQSKLRKVARSFSAKGGLGRNLAAMMIWQGANYLAPLVTFPYLSRILGPSGLGEYGIYLVVGGWMVIASDWGTNFTGSRLVAQHNALYGNIDKAFWNIFFLRLIIVAIILASSGIYLVAIKASLVQSLLVFSAWTISFGSALTVSWCLQGMERLDAFATAALVGRVFTVVATVLLVRQADEVWIAVAVQGGGGIVIGISSMFILYRSRAIKSFHWSWRASWLQALEGLPVLSSTVSHGLYSSTATVLLGIFHGSYETGLFVAADRIRLAVQGLVQPIGQTFYPRTSRLAVTDPRAAVRTIRLLLVGIVSTMVCGCLVIIVFAPLIIHIIAGPPFAESSAVLQILAVAICAYGANAVLGWQALLPFGLSKEYGRVTSSAALVNVIVMPGLVYFWNALGGALGVALTELFMLTCYILIVVRRRLLSLNAHREPSVFKTGTLD